MRRTEFGLALGGEADIVVLDVMLPAMSGVEVLRQIRRQSQIPILMLTQSATSPALQGGEG